MDNNQQGFIRAILSDQDREQQKNVIDLLEKILSKQETRERSIKLEFIQPGGGLTFESNGYKYTAVIAPGGGQTVTVTTMGGISYTQNLSAGLNQVTWLDGDQISQSGTSPVTLLVIRDDVMYQA